MEEKEKEEEDSSLAGCEITLIEDNIICENSEEVSLDLWLFSEILTDKWFNILSLGYSSEKVLCCPSPPAFLRRIYFFYLDCGILLLYIWSGILIYWSTVRSPSRSPRLTYSSGSSTPALNNFSSIVYLVSFILCYLLLFW